MKTRAKAPIRKFRSTKSEIRNKFKTGDTKQVQCSKQEGSNSAFWIFEFKISLTAFVSDFVLRILNQLPTETFE